MSARDGFDHRLLHWIAEHRVDPITSFSTHLMNVSEKLWVTWTIALLGVVVVIRKRIWRVGLAIGIAFYGGAFIADGLKVQIERARPMPPDALVLLNGYAMPSTHAAFTLAPVVALLVTVRWRSRRALVLVASVLALVVLLIGVSMVYLGAHWATDVLVGWAVGIVVGAGVGAVFRPRTGQSINAPHRSAPEGHDD